MANGRAKFESSRISTEKPMRFFSRSRPGTPLLPVKAPKVIRNDRISVKKLQLRTKVVQKDVSKGCN